MRRLVKGEVIKFALQIYNTVLDRFNDRPIQKQFPNSKPWEREQLITGICSDKCWNEFLGQESRVVVIFFGSGLFTVCRLPRVPGVFWWSETLEKRLQGYSWIVAKTFFKN